jgi:hypothetical protein
MAFRTTCSSTYCPTGFTNHYLITKPPLAYASGGFVVYGGYWAYTYAASGKPSGYMSSTGVSG